MDKIIRQGGAVKVCDALCGSGKTSACINMMNSCTDRKFIFITQYLEEAERIVEACSSRSFIMPDGGQDSVDRSKRGITKLTDIHNLISQGRNIATTHALFISYTDETKRLIKEQGYILVLDETVDVLGEADIKTCDLEILIKSGAVTRANGNIEWTNAVDYSEHDGRFIEEVLRMRSKNLSEYNGEYLFWCIPPDLFTSFADVYVLTYMFNAQYLKCFFDVYGIPYELIGTKKTDAGYSFCPIEEMDRAVELRDKIHILENDKINAIGNNRTSLSYTWYRSRKYKEEDVDLDRLRRNISNVFKNVFRARGNTVIWTTFKEFVPFLSGRGYTGGFVPYNMRASNKYANAKYLAYCVNNFLRPVEARYFRDMGARVDENMYALSILIQWIFRSAIRKGEEVWVYIPSSRMRALLIRWLDNLAAGKDLETISINTKGEDDRPPRKRGRPRKSAGVSVS